VSQSDWITVAEAARRLGVDRHTLYDAAARGEVPARRVGRSVRVPLAWVEGADLAAANGHTAADPTEFARQFTAAVFAELSRAFNAAAQRAAVPDAEPGTATDDLTAATNRGHSDGSG
jgi:excisionase family DNA binding protein